MGKQVVYILAADGDEMFAEQLAKPIRAAGYEVVHNGVVSIGESIVGEAIRALESGSPIVLCATARTVGSAWTHKIINASQSDDRVRIFVVLMEKHAFLDQLALSTRIARYCDDPVIAVRELLEALARHFPITAVETPSSGGSAHPQFLDRPVDAVINFREVDRFRQELREELAERFPPSLTASEFLNRAGLHMAGHLTRTGGLLFAETPTIVNPAAMVKCAKYMGSGRDSPRNVATYEGTLREQIIAARLFIAEHAKIGEAPSPDQAQSAVVYQYPMVAVREIIANALVHRDYRIDQACVHVRLFPDRLEISSPGTWLGRHLESSTKYHLGDLAGQSIKRNFRLAHILSWIRLVEGEGSGVPSALRDCKDVHSAPPTVVQEQGFVTVTLYPSSQKPSLWSREIPFRNRYFTGREAVLAEIHAAHHQASVSDEVVQVLVGLGGIGKTEIVAEYAHRNMSNYDLVWWIRAENEGLIEGALARLGTSIGIFDKDNVTPASARVVLEALSSSKKYARWLIIFDNATDPASVRTYIPRGAGHVIITTRRSDWHTIGPHTVEIAVFSEAEAVEYLRRRVPQLARLGQSSIPRPTAEEDAKRTKSAEELAAELGFLPLALEHAAAYLRETGASVAEYLEMFHRSAGALLSTDVDIAYPLAVSTVWSSSMQACSQEAQALFYLLSYLPDGPAHIELLMQSAYAEALPEPLGSALADHSILRRTLRELHRFSLANIDVAENTVQVHRVVRAITRARIEVEDPSTATQFRQIAHALLAPSDEASAGRD